MEESFLHPINFIKGLICTRQRARRERYSENKAGIVLALLELIKNLDRASLVAQWLRVCLPTQGTQAQALVWEDPTCRGATGPMNHNY